MLELLKSKLKKSFLILNVYSAVSKFELSIRILREIEATFENTSENQSGLVYRKNLGGYKSRDEVKDQSNFFKLLGKLFFYSNY